MILQQRAMKAIKPLLVLLFMILAIPASSNSNFTFTGAISGYTLTVSGTPAVNISLGQQISGALIPANTYITSLQSGAGGAGTYTVNNSLSVGQETMTVLAGPALGRAEAVLDAGPLHMFANFFKSAPIPTASGTKFPLAFDVYGYPNNASICGGCLTGSPLASAALPASYGSGNWVLEFPGTGNISLQQNVNTLTLACSVGSTCGCYNGLGGCSGCTFSGSNAELTGTNCRVVFSFNSGTPSGRGFFFLNTATYSGMGGMSGPVILARASAPYANDEPALLAAGANGIVFNIDFLTFMQSLNLRTLRYLDLAGANFGNVSQYSYRPPLATMTWLGGASYPQTATLGGAQNGAVSCSCSGGTDSYTASAYADEPASLTFTGSITGSVWTVTATSGSIPVGQEILGSGVTTGTYVLPYGTNGTTGTGGLGTYALNKSQSVGSESMTSGYVDKEQAWGILCSTCANTGSVPTLAIGGRASKLLAINNGAAGSSNINGGHVSTLGTITGGTLYTTGSYSNVAASCVSCASGSPGSLTLNITVAGGAVTVATVGNNSGSALTVGDVVTVANSLIGGTGSGFSVPITLVSGTFGNTSIHIFTYDANLNVMISAGGNINAGLPVEIYNATCNVLIVNCWWQSNFFMTDAAITSYGSYFKSNLDPGLEFKYEYANEEWNAIFPVNHYAALSATALGLDTNDSDDWYCMKVRKNVGDDLAPLWAGSNPQTSSVFSGLHMEQWTNISDVTGRLLCSRINSTSNPNYTGPNYSTVGQRAYDVVKSIGYAAYIVGDCFGTNGTNYSGVCLPMVNAALDYNSGDATRQQRAFNFVDWEYRQGNLLGGGQETLQNSISAGWFAQGVTASQAGGGNLRVEQYEGGTQTQTPSVSAMISAGFDAALWASGTGYTAGQLVTATDDFEYSCIATCSAGVNPTGNANPGTWTQLTYSVARQIQNLVVAYQQSAMFAKFYSDYYATFMSYQNSFTPSQIGIEKESGSLSGGITATNPLYEWTLLIGDIYSTKLSNFGAMQNFSNAVQAAPFNFLLRRDLDGSNDNTPMWINRVA
jgi:hypothetical protein